MVLHNGNGPDPIQNVILELFPHGILLFAGVKDKNHDNFGIKYELRATKQSGLPLLGLPYAFACLA